MSPNKIVTIIAGLMAAIATNLLVNQLLKQEEEIELLRKEVDSHRLTLQELIVKPEEETPMETETKE